MKTKARSQNEFIVIPLFKSFLQYTFLINYLPIRIMTTRPAMYLFFNNPDCIQL
eukprot:10760.XXX_299173_299331_1 [CDS] Oithona nana genome sequencing.